jgi:hypothetical protein
MGPKNSKGAVFLNQRSLLRFFTPHKHFYGAKYRFMCMVLVDFPSSCRLCSPRHSQKVDPYKQSLVHVYVHVYSSYLPMVHVYVHVYCNMAYQMVKATGMDIRCQLNIVLQ